MSGVTKEVLVFPASFSQQRLWFLNRLEPGAATFNMSAAVRLTGPLNAPALEQSIGEVVRRHESLRTTLVEVDGEPFQVVSPFLGFTLPTINIKGEREAEELARQEARRPFDLAQGPLLRATLLRPGADQHILLLTMHHAISDGWSVAVFIREMTTLYRAFAAGEQQ